MIFFLCGHFFNLCINEMCIRYSKDRHYLLYHNELERFILKIIFYLFYWRILQQHLFGLIQQIKSRHRFQIISFFGQYRQFFIIAVDPSIRNFILVFRPCLLYTSVESMAIHLGTCRYLASQPLQET